MNRFMAATFLTLFGLFVYAPPSLVQQEQAKSARKIVSRIMPAISGNGPHHES